MSRVMIAFAVCVTGCVGESGPAGAEGPRGTVGPAGERGPAGPPGTSAVDYGAAGSSAQTEYRPVLWISCNTAQDWLSIDLQGVGQDGLEESLLSYAVTGFSNGDIQTTCHAAIGTTQSGSSSNYFPSTTVGSTTASCIGSADYPFPGFSGGFWAFKLSESGPFATYNDDAGNPLAGRVYSFTADDCSLMKTDDNGSWASASFSASFN